jgi:hypothetical protein
MQRFHFTRWPGEAAQAYLSQDVFAIGNLDGKELR